MSWLWLEIERRYADPAYAPDWEAGDRPDWAPTNERKKAIFGAWASTQLDELSRRVREDRIKEIEVEISPDTLRAVAKGISEGREYLQGKFDGVRLVEPTADVNRMVELERLQEIRAATGKSGRGRPASGPDPDKPAAQAARDLWRIRHLILPRFWPDGAKAGRGVTNEELARIAVTRHRETTASAALNWYENERLASL